MTKISLCPITRLKLKPLVSLKQQPIFMGTTIKSQSEDRFHEMEWEHTDNGIVHLTTRLPLEILYAETHNSGLVGNVWRSHHQELANFISKFNPMKICEIGGGHGVLSLDYSKQKDFEIWEIFEPNSLANSNDKIIIRDELFSETSKLDKKDCFIHSHLFEHLYDHGLILDAIHKSLVFDGHMIFSVPNMTKMVQKGWINALNFEHVTFLPEDLVEYLLIKHGFSILEKKYFLEDHSIFYCCQKVAPNSELKYYNPNNIQVVRSFFEKAKQDIKFLNKKIASQPNDVSIYLFGAHIFSQFYLTNGLKKSCIIQILDNDPAKQNNRLYGTDLIVGNPEIIRHIKKPVVILKVGAYRNEIITQLKQINPDVKIIE